MDKQADHPQRYALVNELHARPSPRLSAPCTAVFLAFKEPVGAANRDRAHDVQHLVDLTSRYGAPRPDPDDSHYQGQAGRYELKWERHTEFVTYMATTPGLPARPFDPAVATIFSQEWQAEAPGKRLAALIVQVDILPEDAKEALTKISDWFVRDSLAVVWVLDDSAVIAGDFRIDAGGWMRFALFVKPEVGEGRIGRIVHRLVELETYRAMSMLGLQRARVLSDVLNELEPRLTAIIDGMGNESQSAETVLQELLQISAELEGQAAQHSFRFGATSAYQAIVMDRIAALRESRFYGRQMLTEFMQRRYQPAMRTIASAEARLRTMLERATRAGELLRTRVDVERSAQHHSVLARMDKRADMQLQLQHTVEGLSVFAISYYAVGLLSYAIHPLASRIGIDKSYLIAGTTPVVVLLVWWSMRQVRRKLHQHGDDDVL